MCVHVTCLSLSNKHFLDLLLDKKICRCNLTCRNDGHYHCPICDTTIIRRADMEAHVKSCAIQQTSTSAAAQSNPSQDSSFLSLQPSASPSPDLLVQQSIQTSSIVHSSADTQLSSSVETEKLKKVDCPLCSVTCHLKNLAKHMQRKHPQKSKDVTQTNHLKSVCVDAKNGISAVQKGGHGFSVPIHVQNKTWGRVHKVQCELEDCKQYSKMASRSGLTFTHCEHIHWCTEMVHLKFFGDSKKSTCLKMQKYAQAVHVPLCVEVSFVESSKHFCFSVHEPTLHYYSLLGRIFVTYNSSANTWHCPCAKPRMSCVHKNISKRHLFQTNRDVFKTEETSTSTPQKHQDTVYLPSAEDVFKGLVKYICRHKKLPANLPDDAVKPRALTDYITELHPAETVCALCPGPVHLVKSARISRKARIIAMNGVIESK